MTNPFHQNLSQLRKKKRVSQRLVAGDLFISQALLSHYENGIREPGLDFVNRACDYYGVTADFLLGRTEADLTEHLSDPAADEARMDARALAALLQTVGKLEDEALSDSVLRCFGAVTYQLLRHMASADSDRAAHALSVPENRTAALSDVEWRRGEVQFLDCLERLSADTPMPSLPRQMEALLTSLDKQISKHMQSEAY